MLGKTASKEVGQVVGISDTIRMTPLDQQWMRRWKPTGGMDREGCRLSKQEVGGACAQREEQRAGTWKRRRELDNTGWPTATTLTSGGDNDRWIRAEARQRGHAG